MVDTTQMAQSFKIQSGPDMFISKKYPIKINFGSKGMLRIQERKTVGFSEKDAIHSIGIEADWQIYESTTAFAEGNHSIFTYVEISTSPTMIDWLINKFEVDISTAQVMIGNIPALPYDDDKSAFLLIPGLYARLHFESTCHGLDDEHFPEDKDDPFWCAKVNAAQNFLIEDGIRWTEPIHTSSKQFLDWKAHILALIEEARRVEALTSEK